MSMIGDNIDPGPAIIDRLTIDYSEMAATIADHEAMFADLPETVETKAQHDAVADAIAKARGYAKHVETARTSEKEPYLRSERAVDGFFRPFGERLDKIQSSLRSRLAAYLRKVEDEKRREAERVAAEQRRKADELRRAEEKRRADAEAAKRDETKARHTAVADTLAKAREQEEGAAVALEAAAKVKPADLARTRSEQGSLSTLKEVWTFAVEDYDAIDLNKLAPYIKRDAIDQAIRSAVKIGLRELPGVRIYQTTEATVR